MDKSMLEVVHETARGWHKAGVMSDEELERLLSQITPENVHDEVSFGRPVGKEAL